jgi:hypothetical protein
VVNDLGNHGDAASIGAGAEEDNTADLDEALEVRFLVTEYRVSTASHFHGYSEAEPRSVARRMRRFKEGSSEFQRH